MKNKKEHEFKVSELDTRNVKIVYYTFQVLIILTLLGSILSIILDKANNEKSIEHIFLCVVALILYNVPNIIKSKLKIYIPSILQIFALIFIFAHFILGEIGRVYYNSVIFDKVLHTFSGLAFSTLGFSLLNLLNKSKNTHLQLSPFFVAIFAFCFSMAIAALWEVFEYSMDFIFGTDMQKWMLTAEELAQNPIPIDALRKGLNDTMIDISVTVVGTLFVCIVGYISLRTKSNLLNRLLLRYAPNAETMLSEAEDAHDTELMGKLKEVMDDKDSITDRKNDNMIPEQVLDEE